MEEDFGLENPDVDDEVIDMSIPDSKDVPELNTDENIKAQPLKFADVCLIILSMIYIKCIVGSCPFPFELGIISSGGSCYLPPSRLSNQLSGWKSCKSGQITSIIE